MSSAARRLAAACLLLWLAVGPAFADPAAAGEVVRANPDGSATLHVGGEPPQVGDVFTLRRDGERIGEVEVRAVRGGEVEAAPARCLLGSPRLGDEVVFARHRETAAGSARSWITYLCPDPGFAVTAPNFHKRTPARLSRQRLAGVAYEFLDAAQRQYYYVKVFDTTPCREESRVVPTATGAATEAEERDDDGRAAVKRSYEIVKEGRVWSSGMWGYDLQFRFKDGSGMRMRRFVVGKRMILLEAISGYHALSVHTDEFLDSFRLLKWAQEAH